MSARIVLSLDGAILKEVELTKPVTVVGRHPDCDVVVEDGAVSGRHMLFRVVNVTVYAEDLASTNGTRVNGLSAQHQVVHHLDVIEVGRHKVHFFDSTMLAGRVGGLENTVLTEYERTMMAEHVAAPAPSALPPPAARARDDDLDRTMAIPRDPALRLGPAQESVRTGAADAPGSAAFSLKVVAGERRGDTIPLQRANTMIGTPGGETALVVRRGDTYYLARFSGNRPPRLNRRDLGPGTHPIAPQDVIDVGGSSFEVVKV
ncbi:MAG TPA: FHA domain-containing protein [Usitatibacter sp.]|nr:FHA domain-containing protein [Usitatibacter sp.]